MDYIYILATVIFTVFGQIVLKWQMNLVEKLPENIFAKYILFIKLICTNIWIIAGFSSAFLASLCWMAAVSKFDLSHAYPFMSLSFVLVMILSVLFFNETINIIKITGVILIVLGIVLGAQG